MDKIIKVARKCLHEIIDLIAEEVSGKEPKKKKKKPPVAKHE
jgi:hypothetical protein